MSGTENKPRILKTIILILICIFIFKSCSTGSSGSDAPIDNTAMEQPVKLAFAAIKDNNYSSYKSQFIPFIFDYDPADASYINYDKQGFDIAKKAFSEQFGNNYSVNINVTSRVKDSYDELNNMNMMLDFSDCETSKAKESYMLYFTLNFKSESDSKSYETSAWVAKIGNSWKCIAIYM